MEIATQQVRSESEGASTTEYVPLARENRTAVDTDTAAYHLIRKPQTLRIWACRENGPIRPVRVHGRLMWSVAEIRKLVGA